MRKYLIKLLGGYTDIDSLCTTIPEEEKGKILSGAVKKVFNTISEDDILKITPNGWEHRGKPLTPEAVELLKGQARELSTSFLWNILKSELKWVAIKSLMEDGKDGNDIRAAQLLGYLTRVVDDKIKKIGA